MKSLLLVLLVASTAAAQPAPRDVDITAPDGTSLKASYFAAGLPAGASAKAGPAVMLMHMCVTTRKSWEPVATLLSGAGINVLTIDSRGFGQSGGPRYEMATPDVQREVSQKWPADFDAAFAWLVAQPGIDTTRIGAGGASCGVDNAVQLARRHPEVRSLVLLAGPTDTAGVDYLQTHPWLPIFTSAAADDQYDPHFPEQMQWLAEITGNPRNTFVGFKDGRHGTEMFGRHPDLPRQIAAWFDDTLIKSPATPGAAFTPKKTPISEFWAAANQRGGAGRATQLWREARTRDPKAFLFPEFQLNLLAYTKLQSADTADKDAAVELFKLVVEAYPTSANAQDSLSDGYLAIGQNDLALAAEQKCLELLPADTIPEPFKVQLRKVAEEKIAKLKSKMP